MDQETLRAFSLTAVAIVLEATPFLLLGSLMSGVFEVLVPAERIEKSIPKSRLGGVLFGLALGGFLPTCECGVVPIVRRLLRKGFPPHAAISYMLAAPVVNPVVIAATYTAFRGNWWLVGGRLGVVCLVAATVGLTVSGRKAADILRPEHDTSLRPLPGTCAIPAMGRAASISLADAMRPPTAWDKALAVARHMTEDYLEAGKYLLLGALVSAAFKTFLPASALAVFETNFLAAIGAMLLLAIFLAICSEADAFVAASFASFPDVSKLAFVTLGPMFDLKLLFMFSGVFKRRMVALLAIMPRS